MNTSSKRDTLARHLDRIHTELTWMLTEWEEDDTPADIIHGDEYPFTESLEEMIARVESAVTAIRGNDYAPAPVVPAMPAPEVDTVIVDVYEGTYVIEGAYDYAPIAHDEAADWNRDRRGTDGPYRVMRRTITTVLTELGA